jgi:hypothetical protein
MLEESTLGIRLRGGFVGPITDPDTVEKRNSPLVRMETTAIGPIVQYYPIKFFFINWPVSRHRGARGSIVG